MFKYCGGIDPGGKRWVGIGMCGGGGILGGIGGNGRKSAAEVV